MFVVERNPHFEGFFIFQRESVEFPDLLSASDWIIEDATKS